MSDERELEDLRKESREARKRVRYNRKWEGKMVKVKLFIPDRANKLWDLMVQSDCTSKGKMLTDWIDLDYDARLSVAKREVKKLKEAIRERDNADC